MDHDFIAQDPWGNTVALPVVTWKHAASHHADINHAHSLVEQALSAPSYVLNNPSHARNRRSATERYVLEVPALAGAIVVPVRVLDIPELLGSHLLPAGSRVAVTCFLRKPSPSNERRLRTPPQGKP